MTRSHYDVCKNYYKRLCLKSDHREAMQLSENPYFGDNDSTYSLALQLETEAEIAGAKQQICSLLLSFLKMQHSDTCPSFNGCLVRPNSYVAKSSGDCDILRSAIHGQTW